MIVSKKINEYKELLFITFKMISMIAQEIN